MKNKKIYLALLFATGMGFTSCDDFLTRPAEDSYISTTFYANEQQCYQGVNPLYNSPWYDFSKSFYAIGETLSGNHFDKNSQFWTHSVNSTTKEVVSASNALWSVNAYANKIISNLKGSQVSEKVKNTCIGECLTWKAMAYFFLVRIYGAVPIVHDNEAEINGGQYNDKYKAEIPDVYEYIIMTLEKAIELLPESNQPGRIDQYSAKGLLAKVYLAKSGYGQTGSRNVNDLKKAAELAKDVIDNSGRELTADYTEIFKLKKTMEPEALISWQWSASADVYTCSNNSTSIFAIQGFSQLDDGKADSKGPSVDLQDAFGENALSPIRKNDDVRRKATMMMCGDTYDYFWRNSGGFDYIKHIYNKDNGGAGKYKSLTGANAVKQLYGNADDHMNILGVSASKQHSQLPTHILRLADVYLIYAEAMIGNNGSTTDASAIDAFYKVRHRAIATYEKPASITWEDVWKERRLELAYEGDRWYDFVRLSYYDADRAINELAHMRNGQYKDKTLDNLYKTYNKKGTFTADPKKDKYDASKELNLKLTKDDFSLPFPAGDVVFNPHLLEDPVHIDVRSEFSY